MMIKHNVSTLAVVRQTRSRSEISAWAGVLAMLVYMNVHAQSLEEIVVTAQKREQSVQDVPISMTVLSGDQLQALGVTNAKDIAQQTPGLIMTTTSTGTTNTLPTIRGVTQNDFSPHQEPPNAVYVDEAYISSSAAIGFNLFDIQRAEVLRGPQGTLFGRNATGGAIQFVTNKPTDESWGYVDVQYGSFDSKRVEAAIGGQLAEHVEGRIAGLYEDDGPWWKNEAPPSTRGGNSDTFANRFQGARGQLKFDFGAVSDLLSVTVGEVPKHAEGTYKSIPGALNALGLGYDIPANLNANATCPGCDDFGYRDPNINTPFESSFASVGYLQKRFSSISNRLSWTLTSFTVTSLTNYQRFTYDYQENCDGTPVAACIYDVGQSMHQVSEELRLNGDSGPLNWTAGVYALDIAQNNHQGYGTNVLPTDPLAIFGFVDGESFPQSTTSVAVFGQTEWQFEPDVTLVTGLRGSYDHKEFQSSTFEPGQAPFYSFTAADGDPTIERKGDWSGKMQLDYRAIPQTLLYAGVTRGSKGPGFNATPLGALPSGYSVQFKAEELTDYEVGGKTLMANGKVSLDGSLYYYDYKNYQAFEYVLLSTVVTNKDASLYGGELALAMRPDDTWLISAGLSLENGVVYDIRLPLGDIADRAPAMMPHVTANGLIRKSWPLFGGSLSVQGDGRYTGSHYASVANSPTTFIPGAALFNGRLSFVDATGHWEGSFNVKNIANRGVINYAFDLAGSYGLNLKSYEQPRWYIGEIRYKF